MFQNRSLRHEPLESRRLLAASCDAPDPEMFADVASQPVSIAELAEGEFLQVPGDVRNVSLPVTGYSNIPYGADLIQEHGNRLFVVDQIPYSSEAGKLVIFERAEDGSLTETSSVEVSFPVDQMFVLDEQVVLIGNSFSWDILALPSSGASPNGDAALSLLPPFGKPKVSVMTVNFGSDTSVVTQELDGRINSMVLEGDTLVVTGNQGFDVVIAIYPPPVIENFVQTYRVTPEGLQQIASVTSPHVGITQVNAASVYSAFTIHPDVVYFAPGDLSDNSPDATGAIDSIRKPDDAYFLPTAFVSRYALGEDAITEVATFELGSGYVSSLNIAEDGLSGVAVRIEHLGVGPSLAIDLLDFSNDSVSLFESVRLENFVGDVIAQNPEYIVLRSFSDNSLIVVNTNQSIDLSAENRVRRIKIPPQFRLRYESLQINDEMLVIRADRTDSNEVPPNPSVIYDSMTGQAPRMAPGSSVLLTISIPDASIIADTTLDESVLPHVSIRLLTIDSGTSRFGFVSSDYQMLFDSEQLTFGGLSDSGEFVRGGAIPVGRWLEIDANADRLLARTSDRLFEFEWLSDDEPIVTPLGDPEPQISAVDDVYTLRDTGRDHFLDVLANDVVNDGFFRQSTVIVSLDGAPEGAEIIGGRKIRIPAAAVRGAESLRLEYTISDGESRSTGVVEIVIRSIPENRVRELVQSVRRKAAEDFSVPLDEVTVLSVECRFNDPLGLPDDANGALSTEPRLGLFVTVSVPNATARYGVTLDGNIKQLSVSRVEKLVELSLRAVNEAGEPLERLVQGQSFWLEFNARDLRAGGRGVYAAFFDLVVPTEQLEITGPVEYTPGYSGVRTGSFSEGTIDDLGAVSNSINTPGSDIQQLLRIGVRAVTAGRVTLRPEPADGIGTASLLHGLSTEVPAEQARYRPLTLSITESAQADPLDVDGSGSVTAGDALAVINFLNRYGNVELMNLEATVRGTGAEGEDAMAIELAQMRRLDTSRDDVITAMDALMIVNDLHRQSFAVSMNDNAGESEEPVGVMLDKLIDHEDDEEEDKN